jgi:hypothetical protein
VIIEGHYYDDRPRYKDIAGANFRAGLWGGVKGVEGFPKKKVPKKGLKKRYVVEDDEWITQQVSLDTLGQRLGYAPFSKVITPP